jgi:cardiolipin synthase
MRQARLVVEPDDGTTPTLNAIRHARKTIDLTIFRFDRHDVAAALEAAVARGVQVRALIACSNRAGVEYLRHLEWRLLEAGVMVARSNNDFARYHAKLMIVDADALHVSGFNFTRADIGSRSLGIITANRRLVREAMRLFEADFTHRPYDGDGALVISPENAREQLEDFIRGARRELLIYDSKLGDARVLRLLAERARAGVIIRIIGNAGKGADRSSSQIATPHHGKIHLRAIVRDATVAFVGSQSLRKAELDSRREVGLFVHEADIVRQIRETFERDWPDTLTLANGHRPRPLDGPDLP